MKTFNVPTGHDEELRLTVWALHGAPPTLWLHRYDSPDQEPEDPNDNGSAFFSGIPLDPEDAVMLGHALILAGERAALRSSGSAP